jgi:hypothetical protein
LRAHSSNQGWMGEELAPGRVGLRLQPHTSCARRPRLRRACLSRAAMGRRAKERPPGGDPIFRGRPPIRASALGNAAEVRAIAWRARLRLCARYRQMLARRKRAAEKSVGRDHRGRSRTRRVHLGNRSQHRAENDRSLSRAANFEAAARTSTPVQGILRRFRERPCRSP